MRLNIDTVILYYEIILFYYFNIIYCIIELKMYVNSFEWLLFDILI